MITVYSSEGCAPCKTILYWLDKNKKEYEYKDLKDNLDEVAKYTSVMFPPVVIVDGKVAKTLSEVVSLVNER